MAEAQRVTNEFLEMTRKKRTEANETNNEEGTRNEETDKEETI